MHHLAAGGHRQLLRRLPGGQQRILQHPALDELPGLQRVVDLLDQIVADSVLAHMDDGVQIGGQGPQLRALLA